MSIGKAQDAEQARAAAQAGSRGSGEGDSGLVAMRHP
jgi:hypothetical protein